MSLKLTNSDLQLNGDIQVVVNKNKKSIELHKAIDIKEKITNGVSLMSIYVDFHNLLQTSTGNIYGSEIKNILNKYINTVYKKEKIRKKLKSFNNPIIDKHNLGTIK